MSLTRLRDYVELHAVPTTIPAKDIEVCAIHAEYHGVADVVFFRVLTRLTKASADDFLHRVHDEFPHWLDGKEHSYLEIGADMGDQGLALSTMGLGSLLGVWELFTPFSMFPPGTLPDEDLRKMAGLGYITIMQPHSERAHAIAQGIANKLDVVQPEVKQ